METESETDWRFASKLPGNLVSNIGYPNTREPLRKMGVAEICRFIISHPTLIDVRGVVDWVVAEGKGMYYWKLRIYSMYEYKN